MSLCGQAKPRAKHVHVTLLGFLFFGRLLATGLVAMLFVQMLINAGMTIGILPITGMTLPFVSSGGSSLVMTWLMVGLVLNVGLRRPLRMERWEGASEEHA